jgi:hypothetical protein
MTSLENRFSYDSNFDLVVSAVDQKLCKPLFGRDVGS